MTEDRKQEVLEACLSYAMSNVSDINEAFEDENMNQQSVIFVQARYIAPIQEAEIRELIAQLIGRTL